MANNPPSKPSKEVRERDVQKKQSLLVQVTDLSIFDNSYSYMKERFAEEMKRIDQQMTKFSSDLSRFYGQSSMQTARPSRNDIENNWDTLTNSPLVQGEGSDKTLKLQFDVSQFDPTEVKVKLLDDVLIVSATHREKSDFSTVYREYTRQFALPPGTDPELVVSSLSRDGVLTVQAPLQPPALTTLQKQN
ncbi:unnamed protein product [Chrysodeixis includens]|uniref:SHSP domain-containing protein n=1 Tax=Chrysodeixis includens TaxID=689277 RepID=A0A9P0BPG2_CHRIL|nr:unnamed protein product [Chrysodeixis includens]